MKKFLRENFSFSNCCNSIKKNHLVVGKKKLANISLFAQPFIINIYFNKCSFPKQTSYY